MKDKPLGRTREARANDHRTVAILRAIQEVAMWAITAMAMASRASPENLEHMLLATEGQERLSELIEQIRAIEKGLIADYGTSWDEADERAVGVSSLTNK